jgi:transposase
MLPYYYGKWQTVYRRFVRWRDKGIWSALFETSTQDADLTEVMLDGTIVRSHACSSGYEKNSGAEQALGRSKGGFTTKIHAMVDALGNPLKFILTGGERHEIIAAEALIEDIQKSNILADKAYDSDQFRQKIEEQDCKHTIPPRKNRTEPHEYDKHIYIERHLIECFFGKLKQFRRVFSRFDKMKSTFQAFIDIASMLINIR